MGLLVGAARTMGPYKRAVTPTMYECFILIEIDSKRSNVQKSGFLPPHDESRWGSDPSIVHVANAAPPTLYSNPRPCDEEPSPSLSWAHRLTMHPLAGVYEIHLCPHKGKFLGMSSSGERSCLVNGHSTPTAVPCESLNSCTGLRERESFQR